MTDRDAKQQIEDALSVLVRGLRFTVRRFPVVAALAAPVEVIVALAAAAAVDQPSAVAALLGFPLVAVLTPTAKAAVIAAASVDDTRGWWGALTFAVATAARRAPVLLLASVLWLAAVLVGVIALIVPGLLILFGGQCLMGALTIERRSIPDAARRSWQLVRPAFLTVVLVFIAAQILSGVVASVVIAVAGESVAADAVAGVIAAPLVHGPLAILFLTLAARPIDHPPPPPPSPDLSVGGSPESGGRGHQR